MPSCSGSPGATLGASRHSGQLRLGHDQVGRFNRGVVLKWVVRVAFTHVFRTLQQYRTERAAVVY
jgi:hypothetical protein